MAAPTSCSPPMATRCRSIAISAPIATWRSPWRHSWASAFRPISTSLTAPSAGAPAGRALAVLAIFHFVCLAWIFFRAEDFEMARLYLAGLGAGWSEGLHQAGPAMVVLIVIGMAGQFTPDTLFERLAGWLEQM